MGATSLALFACEKPEYPRASVAEIRRVHYKSDEPPSITLMSMVEESSGRSEHVGILINGSERVLYDPAGTYYVVGRPRRNDIHYGMRDVWIEHYESFHARLGFYVETQRKEVPLAVADQAIRLSEEKGETYYAFCADSASWVLRQLPGFESIPRTFSPNSIRKAFAKLPGVKTNIVREFDHGKNLNEIVIDGFDPYNTAPPPKPEYGRGEF